jgi:hypothetical protein
MAIEADRLRSEGVPDAEARARRLFGNSLLTEERYYESSQPAWWDALSKDMLYAFRTLRRSLTFTAAAALTPALGIGANTALFTVIYAVLLRPLPYPEPGRLVKFYERLADGTRENWSRADFLDFWRQSASFAYLAGYREENVNLTGYDRPQPAATHQWRRCDGELFRRHESTAADWPVDGVTFSAAVVLLMTVAVVASYVPARRLMSIDPVVVLRAE